MVRRARVAQVKVPEPKHDHQQLNSAILDVKASLRTLDASGSRLERATARTRTRLCTQYLGVHSAKRQQREKVHPAYRPAGKAISAKKGGSTTELQSFSSAGDDSDLESYQDSEGGSSTGQAPGRVHAHDGQVLAGESDCSESGSEDEVDTPDTPAEVQQWAAIGILRPYEEVRNYRSSSSSRPRRSGNDGLGSFLVSPQTGGANGGGSSPSGAHAAGRHRVVLGEELADVMSEALTQPRPAAPRFQLQVASNRPFSAPQVHRAGYAVAGRAGVHGAAATRQPQATAGAREAASRAATPLLLGEAPRRAPPSAFATPRRPRSAYSSPTAAPERLLAAFACEPQSRCMAARGGLSNTFPKPARHR